MADEKEESKAAIVSKQPMKTITEEEYQEYQFLKAAADKDLEAHKTEFDNYPITWPEDMSNIAEIKLEKVKSGARHQLINAWEQQRTKDIMDLNSPGIEGRINELKLNFRNYKRQMTHLSLQMKLEKSKRAPEMQKLSDGSMLFNKEKLQLEIQMFEKRLKFFGLDPQKVMEEKY